MHTEDVNAVVTPPLNAEACSVLDEFGYLHEWQPDFHYICVQNQNK